MKTVRKMKILELIQTHDIETQDELLQQLKACGHNVTQATISRDIKELRLVKALNENGKYRYVASQADSADSAARFNAFFAEAVYSVSNGQNIVCIKCNVGMAQAVCASLDNMQWGGVVGTLAGDDTIFVLCVDEASAINMVDELKKLYSSGE